MKKQHETADTHSESMFKKTKVVVFASGGFALPTIEWLANQRLLAGIVVPDPYDVSHAAMEIAGFVSQLQQLGLPTALYQRNQISDIARVIEGWAANLGVIATFPFLLPNEIINTFTLGVYNQHASALPNYPGPAPLYWQIRNREQSTALTLHRAEKTLDSGPIVYQRSVAINPRDTVQSLANRMAFEASVAVQFLVSELSRRDGTITEKPQSAVDVSQHLHYARRPTPRDNLIDCKSMTADDISALCRATNGQPQGACLFFRGIPIAVMQATPVSMSVYGTAPGTIIAIGDPDGLVITTRSSALRLDVLASSDGIYDGYGFAERFQLDIGARFSQPDGNYRAAG